MSKQIVALEALDMWLQEQWENLIGASPLLSPSPLWYFKALIELEKQKEREQASYEFCESIRIWHDAHDSFDYQRWLRENRRGALRDRLSDMMSGTHGLRLMSNGRYRRF